ncbi:GNAT family N-acetyltransferase [Enterobacter cloacae subsp. dissolvens]|uniref:GNAT family N-acetyltransferase n=1 Tax=Enterobacter cloacae TaxID=550 RepID=UPI001320C949|nr:GNAT family N-acetyltransferase [Enterobacter cloacae subsp. dissolvens]
MTLHIRQATSADSVLLSEMGYRIYPAHFKHLWKSESELSDFLESEYSVAAIEQSLRESGTSWYVADLDQPIGFMKLTWEATIPDTDISGVLLNKLYLDPTKTSNHYGQSMFSSVIELTRSHGNKFLWLEVLEQNERARRFYEKQGMRFIKDTVFETASQRSVLKIMGMGL